MNLQARIREQYPEGLTAILAIGGTRTAYILLHGNDARPGEIPDLEAYMQWAMRKTCNHIVDFYTLGGVNAVVPIFSYLTLGNRTDSYISQAIKMFSLLIDDTTQAFYAANNIDPYFGGIHELLASKEPELVQAGEMLRDFTHTWEYKESHRKLVWGVLSVPLWTFRNADIINGDSAAQRLEMELEQTSNWHERQDLLYNYYCLALYGTTLPLPQFQIGDARNSDLKIRTHFFSLDILDKLRLYYIPYPALFADSDEWQSDLETAIKDLLDDERTRTLNTDYRNLLTTKQITDMRLEFKALVGKGNVIGLSKNKKQ